MEHEHQAFPPRQIETERLLLRPPRVEDAETIFTRYATDPEVTRHLLWRPHASIDDTRGFLRAVCDAWERGGGHRAWVLELRDGGGLIGMVGTDRKGHRVELGYVLERARWGQGLMTEAMLAVVKAAFADSGVWRVCAVCDIDNAASARVMEKAGMRLEGVLRRWLVHPNVSDEPRDCRMYARVRGEG